MTAREAAGKVLLALSRAEYQAYLVGGCVRDLLLNREPQDYDLCTNATPSQIVAAMTAAGYKTLEIGTAFGVITVLVPTEVGGTFKVEVATYRTDGQYSDGRRPDTVMYGQTPEEDVARRDFTINGLLLHGVYISTGEWQETYVRDCVDGRRDLEGRLIRAIGNPTQRFTEDALRMLRAIRFAVQLGFEIEAATWDALVANRQKIDSVSQERVRDELMKMLTSPDPGRAVYLLNQSGLLDLLFPEVARGALGRVLRSLEWARQRYCEPLDYLALFLCGLLPPGGSVRRPLAALKLSTNDAKTIEGALQLYRQIFPMTPSERVFFWRQPGALTAIRVLYPAMAELEDQVPDAAIRRVVQQFDEVLDLVNQKPWITGDDLQAAGLKPGPHFSWILRELEAEQIDKGLTSREAALGNLQDYLKETKRCLNP